MKKLSGVINIGLVVAAVGLFGLANASFAQSPNWVAVTGANTPGYGGVVRFSQATPDGSLWIMTEGGGVHTSTDDGANWSASNTGLDNLRVKAGVMDTSVLPYKAFSGTYGGGVFKSVDGGVTWAAINGGLACTYVTALTSLPTRLLAGTDCQSLSGVYYADTGTAWTLATGLPANTRVNSISRINSTSFGVDYLLANTDNGIYRSDDSGSSWAALSSSPAGPNGAKVYNVRALFYNTNVVRLLATVEGAGVFISEDAGATWIASNSGLPANPAPSAGMSFENTLSLGTLYLAIDGSGVYKSNNRGNSWTLAFAPDVLPATRQISVAKGVLVAQTYAGLLKSSDSGVTWQKAGAGLPGGWTNNLKLDNADNLYASAADGVYKLSGTQWSKMPNLPTMLHGQVKARGATVYATTTNKGVFKFDATAGVWQPINTGLPTNLIGRNPKFVGDGVNPSNSYLGLYGDGVYYTSDAGATWSARNTGLSGAALNVNSMDAYGALIYMSTDAGVFRSGDGGVNWTLIFAPKNASNESLPTGGITADPVTTSTVYVGVFNTDSLGASLSTNGVYKSTDSGSTWTQLNGMAGKKVRDIRFVGTSDADLTLVASAWDDGNEGGLFISNDGGTTWTRESNGLTSNLINSATATNNGAFLATRGSGLFSFADATATYDEWKYFGAWLGTDGSVNYGVSYGAKDINQILSGLTVSGGGQSATASYGSDQTWHADMQFGTTAPPVGNVYTAITLPKAGAPVTTTFTARPGGFNTAFPMNVQPSGGANVTSAQPIFSWTGSASGTYTYGVEVSTGGNYMTHIWSNYNIAGTSVTYAGPPLVPGTQYRVSVQSQQYDAATNSSYGAGRSETFCFQCSGGATGVNFDQLFIGRNAGLGTENFGVGVRYPRTVNDGLATYSIQCPNGASASGQFGSSTVSGTGYEWFNVNLGDAQPATPFNCTSTVTVSGGSANTVTLTVDRFADATAYPNNISIPANSNLSAFTTVTFTNPNPGTTRIQSNLWAVNPNGSLGQQLWFVGNTESPLVYSGPALTPNTNYQLAITSVDGTNTMHAAQFWIPFCYQCGSSSGIGVNLVSGWNLIGNSNVTALDVATVFGEKTKVTTVWKWVPSSSKWAFYAPSMTSAELATYAAGKGYDVLTTVNGGEGVWVNAVTGFTATLPNGNVVTTSSFATSLSSGWSLIAIGDNKTPRAFNNSLSETPPSAGLVAAPVLTTVWAWDSSKASWYFYAPSLDNTNSLGTYTTTKGYLDFGTGTLSPGVGFWVNKP